MRIWIFNHYAQPPKYPGGTRHYDLASSLNEKGCTVNIFSSSFHYTLLKELLPKFKLSSVVSYDGVEFILLKTVGYKKNGFARLMNLVSYPLSLLLHLVTKKRPRPDVIIGSTVHPFAALIGCVVAKFIGVPHVFEVRDLWPETFIDMGVWERNSLASKVFYFIETFTIKRSSAYVVLSPLTVDYLSKRYNVDRSKILFLPNGVNESFFASDQLEKSPSSRDALTIKYVGGLDSVHGLDFLLEIANHLPQGYRILLVGDGKDKVRLINKAESMKLKNVTFQPPVPKCDVPDIIKDSDLLFLSTADVFYGSENKLYEYMAAAKPIIVASNASHNNPVQELNCGIVLDRENPAASADKLKVYIENNYEKFDEIGNRGYKYVLNNRKTSILSSKLFSFLSGVIR
ncbi:glycosyltransferase family 4 protein [Pseudoalteromonas sp. Isolate6]|uniref:glycosyltransferase family 4 protein n=1 Tax=Pseudoalteromonas sp. Isolate6 TaxID=2908527 RepID=UPI001EFC3E23|nr:glycosyltransferase family 4 protein [Pseudoalteromonas sp. Isolate6]MCG9760602.1 glycosyltransferase family 4 protein [Pseudoalteromonas sp. Isolate6]